MILLIDNYDSFVHNLARYFRCLGQRTCVVRNDAVDVATVQQRRPDAIVLSPGPCAPIQAGCCLEVVRHLSEKVPVLGVCLGHQVIGAAYGGRIYRCTPVHGRTSPVHHDGRGIFSGLPPDFVACRYHSLAIDSNTIPDCLEVSARTSDGIVMAIRHRQLPVVGLQFHPESILTDQGYQLLAGFLRMAGLPTPTNERTMDMEFPTSRKLNPAVPREPITF